MPTALTARIKPLVATVSALTVALMLVGFSASAPQSNRASTLSSAVTSAKSTADWHQGACAAGEGVTVVVETPENT
ncbi:MAG: hypothetical protein LBO75_00755, partial [Bifidobacteriaceae bacterium]|nr:hypothetical protein [Bifidobacteriaceae bacterium]